MFSIVTASLNNNIRNTNIIVIIVYNMEHYYEQILVDLLRDGQSNQAMQQAHGPTA
jgi:hypothetical protein